MNDTFSSMRDRMKSFCIYINQQMRSIYAMDNTDQAIKLSEILDKIVAEYGVYDYAFSYFAAWFAGNHGNQLLTPLQNIYYDSYGGNFRELDGQTPGKERLRGFSAFFILITSCIHFKNHERIQQLFDDHEHDCKMRFRDMPLFYDLVSRYDKRNDDLKKALLCERQAIAMLDLLSCRNVGVSCSFASTVSRMLERGQNVAPADAKKALELIDDAIEYNSEYAKYHYIRAKLYFYFALSSKSHQKCLNDLYYAKDECEFAVFSEDTQRSDYLSRVEDYKQLLLRIYEEIDRLERLVNKDIENVHECMVTEDNIDAFKQEILNSSSERELLRYPPADTYGGKYVFICYSRCDYKSVYCDLLELCLKRIPFMYDHGTVLPGYDWDTAVDERIRDPKCVGIIFYLGKNSVISLPLAKEVLLVNKKAESLGKHISTQLFCVNLTGKLPSQMLIETIRSQSESDIRQANLDSERIVRFLTAFTDKGDYISRKEPPLDTHHIAHIISAVRRKFDINPQEV